ncbi:hypothetical protein TVAG_261160 [Trichomonas vaginalis G3]|uniref:Uncharacterized protein n=1 Tax=Trichomonas vaginalis (strain ATCC PRA-98 / G3) TaxID=412133 RepID=A2FPS6_TRIV3|nr:hypothetical protein TVAGG3_0494580 [Trichomonas vaginalis G3]EAX93106.1 hypothetical protein TVAG_261160 [Trichomonas vaginalis G3]KAI5516623.1 hypothetical protein TVAGG3_0494580 [Trichomonas vaginalis G3]|eukprot:XP_001306036.1 hypothetical protein [Trichomonas vaginalis G3]
MNILFCIPLVASWIFGTCLMNFLLHGRIISLVILAAGCSFGEIFSAWMFFIFSLWFEPDILHCMIHSLTLVLFAAVFMYLTPKQYRKLAFPNKPEILLAIVIPSVFVSFLEYISVAYKENNFRGAAYGDTPFHMNIISSFAFGCNKNRKRLFQITAPFFAGEILAYPIIPNFYSSVFITGFNANFHQSIVYPSLIFIWAIFTLIVCTTYAFTRSVAACALSPVFFIFIGGTGFLNLFKLKGKSLFYTDFVHVLGNGKYGTFFHSLIHVILPQRASLFALPICWSVIYILSMMKSQLDIKAFIAIGILVSSLPQVQGHALIALFEFGVCYAVIRFPWKDLSKAKYVILNYLVMCFFGLSLGLFQLKPYMGRVQKKFMRFEPVWVESGRQFNFFSFWWLGLGCFGVIALANGVVILSLRQFKIYFPSLFVFYLSNVIVYQPWNLDNTKVFYAAFIPLALPVVSNFFVYIYNHFRKKSLIVLIPLFLGTTFSGLLAVRMCLVESYNVWPDFKKDMEFANWIKKNTPYNATFVTDTWHGNPVSTLAGRQLLYGYLGWISSHGIDYTARYNALSKYKSNKNNVKLLDNFDVTYYVETPKEKPITPYEEHWKQIYKFENYKVYKRINKTT